MSMDGFIEASSGGGFEHLASEWVEAHPDASFTLVTEGGVVAAAQQARAVAGDGGVGVGPGQVAGAALDAGLLAEVRIDLVPVLLGAGKRLFGTLRDVPALFGTPRSSRAGASPT
jgi:dihydrofolate reductase